MKAAGLLYQVQIKGTPSFFLTRMHLNHHLPRREGSLFITSQQHSSPHGDINIAIPEVMSKTAMRLLALKPRIMSTKHGECNVELGTALGPVSITFSIESLSLTSSQHHVVPQPPSNQAFVSSMPLSPFPRSATSSLLSGHLRRCDSVMGNSHITVKVTVGSSGRRTSAKSKFLSKWS